MGNINQNEDAKVFADNLAYYMKLHKVDHNTLRSYQGTTDDPFQMFAIFYIT